MNFSQETAPPRKQAFHKEEIPLFIPRSRFLSLSSRYCQFFDVRSLLSVLFSDLHHGRHSLLSYALRRGRHRVCWEMQARKPFKLHRVGG